MSAPTKADRAFALLAEQRKMLERAIDVFKADRLDRCDLKSARKMLGRVADHEADMARAPEFFAPLVLGFMGENGWGPLVRSICRTAELRPAIRECLRKDIAA
jgi:hypothetical protein